MDIPLKVKYGVDIHAFASADPTERHTNISSIE